MLRTIQVALVENDHRRHIIYLACNQESVQKRKLHLRKVQCNHQKCAVKIGRYDMRLARQVCGLADDIVPALLHRCDHSGILRGHICSKFLLSDAFRHFRLKIHHIPYSDRVRRRTSFQPDLSSQHSREHVPLRQTGQQIMASRMFHNSSLSSYNHTTKI